MPKKQSLKVLLFDIETSFKIAGVWDRFNQNIAMNQVIQDTHLLSWSAKWLGEKKIHCDALYLHEAAYRKDPTNDKPIIKTVWKLLDEADVVIAHNGKKFDVRVLNARFALHGLPPPSPYKVIDTLLLARRTFKFTSNRLDDLAKALKVGKKISTDFALWYDVVVKHSTTAFKKMLKYNKHDVVILELVYNKLKAWNTQQPALFPSEVSTCNACGSKSIQKRGFYHTAAHTYQVYRCSDCRHCMRASKSEKSGKHSLRSI